MKQLITIILIIINLSVFAQNISGIITNSNGKPIKNANIIYANTKLGTATDSTGYFRIKQINDTLIISQLLYKTEKIKIDNNSKSLNIKLTEKQYLIDEITIKSKYTKIVKNTPWIIDYDITPNNLYISYAGNEGPIIEIQDFNKNILYSEVSERFIEFKHDCLRNIFLHIGNEYFLINFKEFYYEIIDTYNETEFNEIDSFCDVKIDTIQIFNDFSYTKENKIFKLNTLTKQKTHLFSVTDVDDVIFVNEGYNQTKKRSNPINIEKELNKNIDFGITDYYKQQVVRDIQFSKLMADILSDDLFDKHIAHKRIEAPIFKINDTILVINNFNKSINYINKHGKLYKRNRFTANFNKLQIKFVKQDIINSKIYYFINEDNKTSIYYLNLFSNKLKKVLSLKTNIEKPIVINNNIYYIYYDKINDTRTLLKQCINK